MYSDNNRNKAISVFIILLFLSLSPWNVFMSRVSVLLYEAYNTLAYLI